MHFKNRSSFLADYTNNEECFNPDRSVAKSIVDSSFVTMVESLEKDMDFFMDDTKKMGLNKKNEKCIKGFSIEYYNRGGLIYAPIILNLTTNHEEYDFKKMGMNRDDADNYVNHTKAEYNFKRLWSSCYIFGDKNGTHEFLFDQDNQLRYNYAYDEMKKQLNELWDKSQVVEDNKPLKPKM